MQALLCARNRNVHQAALFFEPAVVVERIVVRKQTFLKPRHEHVLKLQALGRVHGHHLQCRAAFGRLRVARFKRGVRQKCRHRVIALCHRAVEVLDVNYAARFAQKIVGRVNQFF